jgi:hypothetical protein
MADPEYPRTRMTRLALHISASSGARVALPRFTPCVLELLDQARPRVRADSGSAI